MLTGRNIHIKSIILVLWMVVLTAVTVVFGAAPMRTLRVALGRVPFALLMVGLSVMMFGLGQKSLAVSLLGLAVLIGLYREFELQDFNPFSAGLASVAIVTSGFYLALIGWARASGVMWRAVVTEKLESLVVQLEQSKILMAESLKVEDLLIQMPSALAIVLILALFISLVFEIKLFAWIGYIPEKLQSLLGFKVPDSFIWVFIASLVGSFIDFKNPVVQQLGVNGFNISLMVFFLQGLAVVFFYFRVFQAGWLWRALTVFMIFGQPVGMMFVSSVGLIDYWAGFRSRLKKAVHLKKEVR